MTSPWLFTLRITPSDHNENGRVCVSDHDENSRVCVGRVPWGLPDENDKGIAAHKTTIELFFEHRKICKRTIARDQAAYSFIAKSKIDVEEK